MANTTARNALEEYRVTVYGNERDDFDLCLSALNDQADNVALVFRALDGMSEETTINEHAQVLTAARNSLGHAVEIMNCALTLLADCAVAR